MRYIRSNLCFSEKVSSKFKGHSYQILRALLYMRHNWSISRAIQANYEWFTATQRAIGNCPAVQIQVQGTYTRWMQLQGNVKEQHWGKRDRVRLFARCNQAKPCCISVSVTPTQIGINSSAQKMLYIDSIYFRENLFERQNSNLCNKMLELIKTMLLRWKTQYNHSNVSYYVSVPTHALTFIQGPGDGCTQSHVPCVSSPFIGHLTLLVLSLWPEGEVQSVDHKYPVQGL